MAPTIPAAMRDELAEYARRLRALFGARVRLVRLFGS